MCVISFFDVQLKISNTDTNLFKKQISIISRSLLKRVCIWRGLSLFYLCDVSTIAVSNDCPCQHRSDITLSSERVNWSGVWSNHKLKSSSSMIRRKKLSEGILILVAYTSRSLSTKIVSTPLRLSNKPSLAGIGQRLKNYKVWIIPLSQVEFAKSNLNLKTLDIRKFPPLR